MGVRWGRTLTDLAQLDRAAEDGFRFVQPSGDLVTGLSEEGFLRLKASVAERGLPFRVSAVPLPDDVRVTQRGFNLYVWTEHLKDAVHRLAELGCRELAWSNGRARVLPVEGELAALQEQLLQFLYMLCEVAAGSGLSVLVEPLGPRRTNLLNSLREIGLSPADLAGYQSLIAHVHLANPRSAEGPRICPRPDDGYDYKPFLQALKNMGYSGGICLPADADAAGLAYCRRLWG